MMLRSDKQALRCLFKASRRFFTTEIEAMDKAPAYQSHRDGCENREIKRFLIWAGMKYSDQFMNAP